MFVNFKNEKFFKNKYSMEICSKVGNIDDFSRLKKEVLEVFEKYSNNNKQIVLQTSVDTRGSWIEGTGKIKEIESTNKQKCTEIDDWLNSDKTISISAVLETLSLSNTIAISYMNYYMDLRKILKEDRNEKTPLYQIVKSLASVVEKDFNIIQPELEGSLIEHYLKKYNLYRSRIMLMTPKTCYSVHSDPCPRIHIPITPNKKSWMVWPFDNQCHRFEEGSVYLVDTTKPHSFFNGSNIDRIHIVASC
jgi:endonuclease III-like uncharacterized protein